MVERPNIHGGALQKVVATALAPKVIAWLDSQGSDADMEDVPEDLLKAFDDALDWDGYKIARALDDMGWEVDSALVDVLDGAHLLALRERDRLVQEWVRTNNIRPAFKVGDMVQTKHRFNGYAGEITRIDEAMGRYLVLSEAKGHVRHGPGTHGTYMDFEDAEEMTHAGGDQCGSG